MDIINFNKLSLYKDNDWGRASSLVWGARGAYPKITVWINGPDKTITGFDNMIKCPMSYDGLNMMFGLFDNILEAENGTRYDMNCYNTKFVDGKRTDEVYIEGVFSVGKDDKGIIYISITAEDKPDVRFDLVVNNKWFKVIKDGIMVNGIAEGSKMFTKNYIEQLKTQFAELLKDTHTTKAQTM